MKYAIYDKAADAYLTKMEFEEGYSDNTQFECRLNEYITKAKILDTKEAAYAAIVRIERFKFMGQPGRFVIHSFDDTSIDQYIISEAGNPTKVVDNITVNLDGTINVKYGTMISHWSTSLLENAVNRMFVLQNAASDIYTSWNNTFDIYKVITIIDDKEHNHYQFINVTAEGLEKYSKNEEAKLLVAGKEITNTTSLLNKRIGELEKANYELSEQVTERGAVANRLLDENNSLKNKVESMKKEARNWKTLYENTDADREELKNVIDIIHTDLTSTTACDDLKDTLKAINCNSGLDNISMENFLTAKDEIRSIINHVITILESHERNKKTVHAAEEIPKAISNDIIAICEADDKFEVTLKKFSQLYESIWIPGNNDDTIAHAFKSILFIFSKVENALKEITDCIADIMAATRTMDDDAMISNLRDISCKIGVKTIDDGPIYGISVILSTLIINAKTKTDWKRRAEEAICDYTKYNEALGEWKRKFIDEYKENHELRVARDCLAEIIYAIRNAIKNHDINAFDCIKSRMKHDPNFNSDPFMAGVRENVKDICSAGKINITNDDLKNSEIARLAEEKDKALERAEKFKAIAKLH